MLDTLCMNMPFGLKLRRTGRYILSHKNSFLIRVQLLDNTAMECTLTVESTGRDCIEAVANKLELQETGYFGLRYLNKQLKIRWIELEKPLKRQIDKHAHDANLYFGVMFYLANIGKLQQEITRYLFYLQIKNNVIDGLFSCTREEAIELASYILQAEFGDHNSDSHVVEYFHDFILFPEGIATNETDMTKLVQESIEQHKRHRGLSPSDAEYNYILKAIHLDGFSQDTFPAKNGFGHDVEVGSSFAGVFIKTSLNEGPVCHEWSYVENISHSKNSLTFEIRRQPAETSLSSIHFQVEDAETAKYIWKMCCAKRRFFLENKQVSNVAVDSVNASKIQRRPTLRRSQESEPDEQGVMNSPSSINDYRQSKENVNWEQQQQQRQLPPHQTYMSSQTSLDHAYVSQTSLNRFVPADNATGGVYPGGSVYSSQSINSLAQSHLGGHNMGSPAASNMSINSAVDRQRGGQHQLPCYRPSPDYDVAVLRQRRRYSSYLDSGAGGGSGGHMAHIGGGGNQSSPVHPNSTSGGSQGGAGGKPRPHSMVCSQRELLRQATNNQQQHLMLDYRRSLQSEGSEPLPPPGGGGAVFLPQQPGAGRGSAADARHAASINPVYLTGSTPELADPFSNAQAAGKVPDASGKYFVSEQQLYRHFTKQPPPYGSTPDLSISKKSEHDFLRARPPPLPTVESCVEDQLIEQPTSKMLRNMRGASGEQLFSGIEQISSNTDQGETPTNELTPEQNVQAYLQHVTNCQQQEIDTQHQYSGRNSSRRRKRQNNPSVTSQQQQQHTRAPSNATMLVYSSDEETDHQPSDDYLLCQQLHDNRAKAFSSSRQHRASLLSKTSSNCTIEGNDDTNSSGHSSYRNHCTAYDVTHHQQEGNRDYEQLPSPRNKGARGPPPPYHTPTGSGDGEDGSNTTNKEAENLSSFQHARRSTIRRMGPLKFAQMNGLNASTSNILPAKGEPDERVLNLESKVNEGHILSEYDRVPKSRHPSPALDAVPERDRCKEITPYSDCCVAIEPSDANPSGYVNASLIQAVVGGRDRKYIACQTPLDGFQHEFWEMVWNEQVHIIALLVQEKEHGKCRCARYWPSLHDDNRDIPCVTFGEFKVMTRCEDSTAASHRVTRNLILERRNEKRAVWLLQYNGWPSTGVPSDVDDFIAFMEELESVRRLPEEGGRAVSVGSCSSNPVVVQCSTGSGRTGVFVLTELMLLALEHNEDISVPDMLDLLRQQRMLFVQTFSQYNFVYKLLISFLKKSRLI